MFKSILRAAISIIIQLTIILLSTTLLNAAMAWGYHSIYNLSASDEMLYYSVSIITIINTLHILSITEKAKIKRELKVMQALNQELYIKLKRLERERQNVTIHKIMKA